MKTYEIEIKETLSKVVEVEAENVDDALADVETRYHDCEWILDADDFVDAEFIDTHADVVTPMANRLEKLIYQYVTEHYGDSEADDPSWAIKPLAEALAKELA